MLENHFAQMEMNFSLASNGYYIDFETGLSILICLKTKMILFELICQVEISDYLKIVVLFIKS